MHKRGKYMILNAEKYKGAAFDVIVLAGQSNALGCGVGSVENAYVPTSDVLYLKDTVAVKFENDSDGKVTLKVKRPTDFVISEAEEADTGDGRKAGNLSLSFARRYVREGKLEQGRRLLIVFGPEGGTGFARNEWGVNGSLYIRLCDMLDELQQLTSDIRLKAFLWHQGECDAFEIPQLTPKERYEKYLKDLSGQMDDFVKRYSCKNLPFVCGGFVEEWTRANEKPCGAVLQALQDFCTKIGGKFVNTSGMDSNDQDSGNGDHLHFCRRELYNLGEKYYEAYLSLEKK